MGDTPNALERLRSRLTVGTVLTVVENTKRPDVQGHTRTLTWAGRTVVNGYANDDTTTVFRIGLPSRVRDVEWLDPDTVRLPLPADHAVTYRITTASTCARRSGPITDPENAPVDDSAVCCRCGDPDGCPSGQPRVDVPTSTTTPGDRR